MLLNLLLVIQIIICVALVAVILLQRSEGGALGMGGGGTGGFMTARGAGNLLTRTTAILATAFFLVSATLTVVGNMQRNARTLSDTVADGPANPNALQPAPLAAPNPSADTEPAAAEPGAAPAQPATGSLDSLAAPLPSDPAPATKK